MKIRQEEFSTGKPRFVYLSTDASMQRGSDFQMTLEDSIVSEQAVNIFLRQDFDWDAFHVAKCIRTTTLPVGINGAGNTSIAGKYECVVQSLLLDVGLDRIASYGRSVISFVSDYGTEAKFVEATRLACK